MIKSLLVAAALLFTPMAAMATPNVPITLETLCTNGQNTWEQGREKFEAGASDKLSYVGSKEFPDKTIAIVYKVLSEPDLFYILAFDANHCFVMSTFMNYTNMYENFGIVVANE